jgi:AraC-like DNA-binding protein
MELDENKFHEIETGIIDKFRLVQFGKDEEKREYEILPDAYFDLSFLCSELGCKILLAGPYTNKTIVPLGRYELFIISFRVGRMPKFLDIKPYELVNRIVELPRIFGLDADIIGEEMIKKDYFLKQNFIKRLLHDADLPFMTGDTTYNHAAAIIEAYGGQIQVGTVTRILGVSNRTLERKFRNILGFPPKMFIRLVRFQKVLEKLRSNQSLPQLADIAYEFGYADQSHFIHDFKELSGYLPGSF